MKRIIYATINMKSAQIGEKYILKDNITLARIQDSSGKTIKTKDSKSAWLQDVIDGITRAVDGNTLLSKNRKSFKLTRGAVLTVANKENRYSLEMQIGDSDYYIFLDPNNDFKKVVPLSNGPLKEPESTDEPDEMWAVYMVPDMYGRSDTSWHWTSKDWDETEKEFRARVKRQSIDLAEVSFQYYNPRSIKRKFFKSKDAFLKFCDKSGFKPKLDD